MWRARRVAEQTLGLSMPAAGFVDAQVAGFAHRLGPAALDRLIEVAKARFMPAQAEADAQAAAERRHVTFHHHQVSLEGTTFVEAELDLADALDLDAAITQRAETLAAAGCTEPLDVRRALAAGDLARHQLALDLETHDNLPDTHTDTSTSTDTTAAEASADVSAGSPSNTRRAPRTRKPRQVVLYVHLARPPSPAPPPENPPVARRSRGSRTTTGWSPPTRSAPGAPPRCPGRGQTGHRPRRAHPRERLRGPRPAHRTNSACATTTCAFPWCPRPARACEIDHVTAHAQGGPTCTHNTAPLCRRHHRLKTHAPGWTYTAIEPGTYLWTSPHGYEFPPQPPRHPRRLPRQTPEHRHQHRPDPLTPTRPLAPPPHTPPTTTPAGTPARPRESERPLVVDRTHQVHGLHHRVTGRDRPTAPKAHAARGPTLSPAAGAACDMITVDPWRVRPRITNRPTPDTNPDAAHPTPTPKKPTPVRQGRPTLRLARAHAI